MSENICFAMVGTDGRDPVIWGVGRTRADAQSDAEHWLAGEHSEDLHMRRIPESTYLDVLRNGGALWPAEIEAFPVDEGKA